VSEREQRFREVLARHAQGWNYSRIARELHLNIRTVKRYVLSRELPKRGAPMIQVVSTVTPYLSYLERRWQEGCQTKTQLWQEIRAQGYQGSRSSVYRALKRFQPEAGRRTTATQALRPKRYALSPRQGMWLLVRAEADLTEHERAARVVLQAASADITAGTSLAQRFQNLLRQRDVEALEPWLQDATTSGIAEFKHFAASLRRDVAAVRAALSLPWSNGQLEAQVNRLKVIKRVGYGRAKFDLLRRRVLATS
jgi:transposase